MRSITIVAEDRVGLLADVSYILGKCSINIEALGVDVVGSKAIIALTVRDTKKTMEVLSRNGFQVTENDALVVKLPNRPGEVNRLADRLAEGDVNIEDMQMISNDAEHGVFAVMVNKPRKAVRMLAGLLLNHESVR